MRDLYNKEIDEILVSGEEGYREAKDFMRMLMPSHAKSVQPYRDSTPIFARNGIEAQLDKMLQPQVTLKSGGYIIINQTEALVAIDVNSGRSTKEHSIEETALHTNLEAAEEVARQLRLRDLAGLIVIDFIDMEENRNNRAVEKKLKDCLKNDRARIQVGRISHFGLMEMSRQRIRASVLESTMKPCPHCGGTGHVRSDSSVALQVVRAIEEFLLKDSRSHITTKTPMATALYVLNHKRSTLVELEGRFGVTITLEADDSVGSQNYAIFRGAIAEKPANFALPVQAPAYEEPEEVEEEIAVEEEEDVVEAEAQPAQPQQASTDGEGQQQDRKRRKRRRRRGGRDRAHGEAVEGAVVAADADEAEEGEAEIAAEASGEEAAVDATELEAATAAEAEAAAKKRRRGKRGGKRNRKEDGEHPEAEELAVAEDSLAEAAEAAAEVSTVETVAVEAVAQEAAAEPEVVAEAATVAEAKPKKPRRTAKSKKADDAQAEAPAVEAASEAVASEGEAKPEKKAAKPRAPRRKAAAAPVEETVVAEEPEVPAEPAVPAEAAEPAVPAEPVVTSVVEDAADASTEAKPKKGGWWQRKGFF